MKLLVIFRRSERGSQFGQMFESLPALPADACNEYLILVWRV